MHDPEKSLLYINGELQHTNGFVHTTTKLPNHEAFEHRIWAKFGNEIGEGKWSKKTEEQYAYFQELICSMSCVAIDVIEHGYRFSFTGKVVEVGVREDKDSIFQVVLEGARCP